MAAKGGTTMELGTKIKQFREKAQWTQKQLADALDVTPQSVSKWENLTSMPDIALLPRLAETFGVTIDELFDLSVEEKLSRIENRMDLELELEEGTFKEYEAFLQEQMRKEEYRGRATSLLAHLYGYRMMAYARKTDKYAKESILLDPSKKDCQWLLQQSSNHFAWDWNIRNHTEAIEFYRKAVAKDKEAALPYLYLIDHLIADHRCDEAERYLDIYRGIKDAKLLLVQAYEANLALARYDEKKADSIIEKMVHENENDSIALFEAAQYYANKAQYDKAISLYERSFEKTTRRPRFIDELMAIADIYQIQGDYKKAAETYQRIVDCQQQEWGMNEEVEIKDAMKKRDELLKKAA